jgi:hypothetical protein
MGTRAPSRAVPTILTVMENRAQGRRACVAQTRLHVSLDIHLFLQTPMLLAFRGHLGAHSMFYSLRNLMMVPSEFCDLGSAS